MNPFLRRAQLLLQQGRADLAKTQLYQSLAQNTDDAQTHSLLALCHVRCDEKSEALQHARQAIGISPDVSFTHYVLAVSLGTNDQYREARLAIEEALRLEPEEPDYYGFLSNIYLIGGRWKEALAAADRGLSFDASNVDCTNARAAALVRMGQHDEADESIRSALARDPENATTHANRGWALLHKGKHKDALEHFREALRRDPSDDWARQGLVEALKARNIVYRLLLAYFLWMSRLSSGARWGVLIGGFIGARMVTGLIKTQPHLAPFLWPLLFLYFAFVILTWVGDIFFNLLLQLSPYGRYALDREQRVAATWFGVLILVALVTTVFALFREEKEFLRLAMILGMMLLPMATILRHIGTPKFLGRCLAGAGVAALGVLSVVFELANSSFGESFFSLFIVSFIILIWAFAFSSGSRPAT